MSDTTKYRLNNDTQLHTKRGIVYAVVKDYVTRHPGLTLEQVQAIFPKSLQTAGRDVVKSLEGLSENETNERYFTQLHKVLKFRDCKADVCNQWGIDNIDKFLKNALNLGYQIEKISNEGN